MRDDLPFPSRPAWVAVAHTGRIKASHNLEAAASAQMETTGQQCGGREILDQRQRASRSDELLQQQQHKQHPEKGSRARERAEDDNHDAAGGARASMTRVLAGGEAIYAVAATSGVAMETKLLFYYSFPLAFFSPLKGHFHLCASFAHTPRSLLDLVKRSTRCN